MPWTTPVDRTTNYTVTATDWNAAQDNLTFLYGDTSWTNVTFFTNSWAASGSTPGYILIGRVVYLRGAMTAGTASSAAFTLPVGYRPTITSWFIVSNSGTITSQAVQITAAGVVTPVTSAVTWLSQISFPIV